MDPSTTGLAPEGSRLIESSLPAAVHQCERHALTCTLVVTSSGERARLDYLGGTLARVEINGFYLDDPDDALGEVVRWPAARCRVATMPPELGPEDLPTRPIPRVAAPAPSRRWTLLAIAGLVAAVVAALVLVG